MAMTNAAGKNKKTDWSETYLFIAGEQIDSLMIHFKTVFEYCIGHL